MSLEAAQSKIAESYLSYRPVDLSTTDFSSPNPFRGIVVGVAGNVVIKGVDGNNATIALPAGVHKLGGIAIIKTSTTATGLTALY